MSDMYVCGGVDMWRSKFVCKLVELGIDSPVLVDFCTSEYVEDHWEAFERLDKLGKIRDNADREELLSYLRRMDLRIVHCELHM